MVTLILPLIHIPKFIKKEFFFRIWDMVFSLYKHCHNCSIFMTYVTSMYGSFWIEHNSQAEVGDQDLRSGISGEGVYFTYLARWDDQTSQAVCAQIYLLTLRNIKKYFSLNQIIPACQSELVNAHFVALWSMHLCYESEIEDQTQASTLLVWCANHYTTSHLHYNKAIFSTYKRQCLNRVINRQTLPFILHVSALLSARGVF